MSQILSFCCILTDSEEETDNDSCVSCTRKKRNSIVITELEEIDMDQVIEMAQMARLVETAKITKVAEMA